MEWDSTLESFRQSKARDEVTHFTYWQFCLWPVKALVLTTPAGTEALTEYEQVTITVMTAFRRLCPAAVSKRD